MLLKPIASLNDPSGHSSSCVCSACHIHKPGSNVAEIVESSRIKAQGMVNIAMQVSTVIQFIFAPIASFAYVCTSCNVI